MDFQLKNGKTLHIKGTQFVVDINDKSVVIEVKNYNFKNLDKPSDYIMEDATTPSYLKQKVEEKKVVKLSEIEKSSPDNDNISKIGKNVFNIFISKWEKGFGDEKAEQPDRAVLLNKTMSDYSLHVIRYVKLVGGLTHAMMHAFPTKDYLDTDYRKKVRLLAENVAQVSSILCPPLSELLEYPFLINIKLATKGIDNE